jgi:hypothetical protein
MSPGLKFRLTSPTIALFIEEGRQVARAIPQGSVIRVDTLAADKFIEVTFDGKKAQMFAQDIKERGERVTGGE